MYHDVWSMCTNASVGIAMSIKCVLAAFSWFWAIIVHIVEYRCIEGLQSLCQRYYGSFLNEDILRQRKVRAPGCFDIVCHSMILLESILILIIISAETTVLSLCTQNHILNEYLAARYNIICNISHKTSLLSNILRPRQNVRHFPDEIFKCISWKKIYAFRLKFHWCLFLRAQLTIS